MSDLDYDALRKSVVTATIRGRCVLVTPLELTRLLDLAQRAEADRAAVERVRALADEWEREEAELVVWYGHEQCVSHNAAMKLRAALDPEEDQ